MEAPEVLLTAFPDLLSSFVRSCFGVLESDPVASDRFAEAFDCKPEEIIRT